VRLYRVRLVLGICSGLGLLGLALLAVGLGSLQMVRWLMAEPDWFWYVWFVMAAIALFADAWRAILEHDRQYRPNGANCEQYVFDLESQQWIRYR
jgi:sterol desaturase/sphingolipid hydroxylase (fatty acid hydroxylase superfamily)